MQRVSIVGTSGSGKSRLGRALAERIGAPYVELDAIHHLPDWTPIDPDEFVGRCAEIAAGESWVIDGNYGTVTRRGPIWERADTVVWLDLPRWLVMWQVTTRSLRRVIRREELWNGNRERWSNLLSRDPERSIIVWAWTTHPERRATLESLLTGPHERRFDVVRLRSRREMRTWSRSVEGTTEPTSVASMGLFRSIGRFLTGLFKRQPSSGAVEPSPDVVLESELKRGMRGD